MDQLKRLRTEKGVSQAKLAALADIDPSTVNQIERGAREASPATLRKLAQALNVSIAELLDDAPKAESRSPLEPSLLDGLEDERRQREEELATASMEALAEEGERLEEELENAVAGIPVSGPYRFYVALNFAELLYAEWSGNRQPSTEFRAAKERLDKVAKRISSQLHQLIHSGRDATAGEREQVSSLQVAYRRRDEIRRVTQEISEAERAQSA